MTGGVNPVGGAQWRVRRAAGCRHCARGGLVLVILGWLGLAAGCAVRPNVPPTVTTPRYPEFIFPALPPALSDVRLAAFQQRGWQFLQGGDARNAGREFTSALKQQPAFYPAEAGLGYVALGQQDYREAVRHFDRALQRDAAYVPALVGRGDALVGARRPDEALENYEVALAQDPSLVDVRRRVEVIRFRGWQTFLASARRAAEGGRLDEAKGAYLQAIAASPDSAFLYRDLAAVERRQGDLDAALADFRKALELDPSDARSLAEIGGILEMRGDVPGAAEAYRRAQAIEPSDMVRERLDRVNAALALAALPAEYRAIPEAPQVTRGDVAALIGVRLAALLQHAPPREAVLTTDTRSHWAAPWILGVARAGAMDVFPNHTFQPRLSVRRADLALTVSRVLNLIAAARPDMGTRWQGARRKIADLSPGNLQYPAASLAVAAGVMSLYDDGTFQPGRPVGGAEAVETIARLEALAYGQ